ncbi:hypothetical protein BJ912DRAFT_1025267 [Pholiota molesta]|nr:hypothetical protein BJ912DRAFT_1025267 [Pholiota molesta]
MPASSSKHYHPYFTPAEIEYLSEKQRGKQSVTQEKKCARARVPFSRPLERVLGCPLQSLSPLFSSKRFPIQRVFLHACTVSVAYTHTFSQDVALAALYVSTKEHDTLKKPRELLSMAYSVRYPELAAKSKNPNGEVDIDTMDPAMVEADRQRLLAIERLILETICFNFKARMPFPYVIKLGKHSKVCRLTLAYRTLLPLIYPPHTIALGSIFVSALLLSFEQPPSPPRENETPAGEIAKMLNTDSKEGWEARYHAKPEDLEDFAHTVLDLLIQYATNPSANTSPSTPSSPSPNLPARDRLALAQQPQYPYKADQLIRLKIAMRETEHPPRRHKPLGNSDPSALYSNDKIGQNEGTVRFLFSPPGFEGDNMV